ncbi:hypothetical protein J1605_007576 [Eschrichtius robustus]|uniref:Zinc fingers and homeoboxes protein 1 n=1 Tax=Eschrichtius robustus TaxID=9764 RepID=A0AB34H2A2_ESCRO|nr:hypothetical protein J1605_007576 [Eschrichtius robustus]
METGSWLLGGEFEDSVFEERRERRPGPLASYRAKLCEPQVRERGLSASSQPPGLALPGPGPTALQTPQGRVACPRTQTFPARVRPPYVHADSLPSLPQHEPQPAGPGPLCPRGNPRAVGHQLAPGVRPAGLPEARWPHAPVLKSVVAPVDLRCFCCRAVRAPRNPATAHFSDLGVVCSLNRDVPPTGLPLFTEFPLPMLTPKEWFYEETGSSDDVETLTIQKFKGDLAYRRQEYQKALQEYSSISEKLPSTNFAMKRDVQEGQARCLVHLGRHEEALEIATNLENKATNTDHLTTVLYLQFAICSSLQNLEKTIFCLQKLISLHPFNPWNWGRLGEAYLHLEPALAALLASSQKQNSFTSSDKAIKSSCAHSGKDSLLCFPEMLPESSALSVETSSGNNQKNEKAFKNTQNCMAEERAAVLLETQMKACASFTRTRSPEGLCSSLTQDGVKGAADSGALAHSGPGAGGGVWMRGEPVAAEATVTLHQRELAQSQQTSFALERNLKTQQEIEAKMKGFSFKEDTLLLIAEVMGEDIVPEKIRDEVHTEVKCVGPAALTALVIASSKEFEDKFLSFTYVRPTAPLEDNLLGKCIKETYRFYCLLKQLLYYNQRCFQASNSAWNLSPPTAVMWLIRIRLTGLHLVSASRNLDPQVVGHHSRRAAGHQKQALALLVEGSSLYREGPSPEAQLRCRRCPLSCSGAGECAGAEGEQLQEEAEKVSDGFSVSNSFLDRVQKMKHVKMLKMRLWHFQARPAGPAE